MRDESMIDVEANTRMLIDRWMNDISDICYLIDQGVCAAGLSRQTTTISLTARQRLMFWRINDALSGATLERRMFTLGDIHFITETLAATGEQADLDLSCKVGSFIQVAKEELRTHVDHELIPVILPLAEWAIVDEKAKDTSVYPYTYRPVDMSH